MSIVPSDSASRVGKSESPDGSGYLRMVPPSDVFMTTLGESALKYMDKYFAAYQSYCRASQALASGFVSSGPSTTSSATGTSSPVPVQVTGPSSSRVSSNFGRGQGVSRSSLRRFSKRMRAKGLSSDLPGGYCYTRAIRPEAREQAARFLGPYPAVGDLLSRPREEFMPLSATTSLVLAVSGDGTTHVRYATGPGSGEPSYNKFVVGIAKSSDFEFGSYGGLLRRASLCDSLPGDFSGLSLETPVGGGGDPGPKRGLVGFDRFAVVWTGFLRNVYGLRTMSKSLRDSSVAVWQAHVGGKWSSSRSLLLRDLGRFGIKSHAAASLVRERKDRSLLAERCVRHLNCSVLASWFDVAFGESLGYLGTVRKSLVLLDLLGALLLASSSVEVAKVLDYFSVSDAGKVLDRVVQVKGVASSVSSLLCLPGYCYASLVQPGRLVSVLSDLCEWPTVESILNRDVGDYLAVESLSYFHTGPGDARCHLSLEPLGPTALDLFSGASYGRSWPSGSLGSVLSRLPRTSFSGHGSAVRVGGDVPAVSGDSGVSVVDCRSVVAGPPGSRDLSSGVDSFDGRGGRLRYRNFLVDGSGVGITGECGFALRSVLGSEDVGLYALPSSFSVWNGSSYVGGPGLVCLVNRDTFLSLRFEESFSALWGCLSVGSLDVVGVPVSGVSEPFTGAFSSSFVAAARDALSRRRS